MRLKTMDTITPQLMTLAREAGLSVHLWTIDDVTLAKRLFGSIVSSVTPLRFACPTRR